MSDNRYQLLINGEWQEAASGARFDSIDPFTGDVWTTISRAGVDDANRAIDAAHDALSNPAWAGLSPTQRGALLRKLGDLIAAKADEIARIEVKDNGKLLAEMGGQLNFVPQILYYYSGLADKIEGRVPPIGRPGNFAYTRREPIGVVLAITPWNSPVLLALGKMAPALAAGCTVVLKPSEFTSASTIEIAKLAEEAGFPPGVINVVTGFGSEIGDTLVGHPKVSYVGFTGGEATGRHVNKIAAETFKKVTLELGGKSPNIVFEDAVIDDAVKGAVSGIFAASGQTCIAGSRLLLQESIHDEFMEKLLALASTAKRGDPAEPTTQVGPVTTPRQFDLVMQYIQDAKDEGANCVMGGAKGDEGPYFVQPTIFTDVDNKMTIAQREVFGPVLAVIKFRDIEHAIEIANDTNYGLASGVWTQSMKTAFTMTERIEAGTVWVNTYRVGTVQMPFGGHKNSGLGYENGQQAIEGFLKSKTVIMQYDGETANPFIMRL